MTFFSQIIHRAMLTTLAVCAFFVGVAGCPGNKLTITYSWPSLSMVHIANSGVPSTAVNSGISGWNAMNGFYECFGPTFIADNNVGSEQINLFFVPLSPDPETGAIRRGVTYLDRAIFILGRLAEVRIEINNQMTVNSAIAEVLAHELGHTQGLWDCPRCGLHSTVMESGDAVSSINDSIGLINPTLCDIALVESVATDYACPPPPPGSCNGVADYTTYPSTGCQTGFTNSGGTCTRSTTFQNRCADPSGYDSASCSCPDGINTSPILMDVNGTGFSMTDAAGGVVFNILNDGVPLQISWTANRSGNAFLVLDRNGNGVIDNGSELFGDLTPQPATAKPNGFLALAEYDKPVNGGNGDGRIDRRDTIFAALKLWPDSNHNGVCEPNELRPLSEFLSAIDLAYKESRRVDQFGNEFRYRSRVFDVNGVQGGRWAWDVFLKVQF
ncbi:MAG TPA: hypothetical protein VJ749_05560 [Pyrinomonadaceae bacterium]|nr:hypothetical protein [Pyrinomonadaceae bacterium]